MTPPPDPVAALGPHTTALAEALVKVGCCGAYAFSVSTAAAILANLPAGWSLSHDSEREALDPGCCYTLSREAFDPIPDEDFLCGLGPDASCHHHLAECGDGSHAPYPGCHPYVPLVEVPHD